MDLSPRLERSAAKIRKCFRDEILRSNIDQAWISLNRKNLWNWEFVEILFPELLAQLESIPTRSRNPGEIIKIISVANDLNLPHIKVFFPNSDEPVNEAEEIPVPVDALRKFCLALIKLGGDPQQVIEEIIQALITHFPLSFYEEFEKRKQDKEVEKQKSAEQTEAEYEEVKIIKTPEPSDSEEEEEEEEEQEEEQEEEEQEEEEQQE